MSLNEHKLQLGAEKYFKKTDMIINKTAFNTSQYIFFGFSSGTFHQFQSYAAFNLRLQLEITNLQPAKFKENTASSMSSFSIYRLTSCQHGCAQHQKQAKYHFFFLPLKMGL